MVSDPKLSFVLELGFCCGISSGAGAISSSLAGGSPVRVVVREPGSRLAARSGNGPGRARLQGPPDPSDLAFFYCYAPAGRPVSLSVLIWHWRDTASPDQPPEDPGLVKVSVPEARRLLRLATTPMTATARQAGYAWSRWRRKHQARRHQGGAGHDGQQPSPGGSVVHRVFLSIEVLGTGVKDESAAGLENAPGFAGDLEVLAGGDDERAGARLRVADAGIAARAIAPAGVDEGAGRGRRWAPSRLREARTN
jgi:hypothetical protein